MGSVVTPNLQMESLKCRKAKECAQGPLASKCWSETQSGSLATALNLPTTCISYKSPMSKYCLLYPRYRMEKGGLKQLKQLLKASREACIVDGTNQ